MQRIKVIAWMLAWGLWAGFGWLLYRELPRCVPLRQQLELLAGHFEADEYVIGFTLPENLVWTQRQPQDFPRRRIRVWNAAHRTLQKDLDASAGIAVSPDRGRALIGHRMGPDAPPIAWDSRRGVATPLKCARVALHPPPSNLPYSIPNLDPLAEPVAFASSGPLVAFFGLLDGDIKEGVRWGLNDCDRGARLIVVDVQSGEVVASYPEAEVPINDHRSALASCRPRSVRFEAQSGMILVDIIEPDSPDSTMVAFKLGTGLQMVWKRQNLFTPSISLASPGLRAATYRAVSGRDDSVVIDLADGRTVFEQPAVDKPGRSGGLGDVGLRGLGASPGICLSADGKSLMRESNNDVWDVDSGRVLWTWETNLPLFKACVVADRICVGERFSDHLLFSALNKAITAVAPSLAFQDWAIQVRDFRTGNIKYRTAAWAGATRLYGLKSPAVGDVLIVPFATQIELPSHPPWEVIASIESVLACPLVLFWSLSRLRKRRCGAA